MTPIRASSGAAVRDFALAITFALAMVISLPALAVAAFVVRGFLVAAVVLALGGLSVAWLWREVMATLPEPWRLAIREYAGPTAFALALVACMPAIAMLAFLLRGALVAVVIATAFIAGVACVWHYAIASRIARKRRHDDMSAS